MTTRWVEASWPVAFQADQQQFFERAGLRLRRTGATVSREFLLTTEAQYERRAESFIGIAELSGVVGQEERLARVMLRWPPTVAPETMEPVIVAECQRLLNRDRPTLANLMQATQLMFTGCPPTQFEGYLTRSLLPSIGASLPDAWAAVINVSPTLSARTAIIRGLFTAAEAPDWYAVYGQGFESMRGLAGPLFQGHRAIVDPFLALAFPWIFGGAFARIGSGLLLVGFGQMVAAREGLRDDDLGAMFDGDLLTDGHAIKVPATPQVSTDALQSALRWWVDRVSKLFSVVLDPTLFASNGLYEPATHQAFIHAIERLFASTMRIVRHGGSDEYSRRIHLFEILDLLDGLHLGGYDQTLNCAVVSRHLDYLLSALPTGLLDLVEPRLRAALAALIEMQDGFLPSAVREDVVDLRTGTRSLPLAVAMLLRTIRNGSHGTLKEMKDPAKRRLLATHNCQFPAALSDLALLHFLRLIAEPELLAVPWLRGAQASPSST